MVEPTYDLRELGRPMLEVPTLLQLGHQGFVMETVYPVHNSSMRAPGLKE